MKNYTITVNGNVYEVTAEDGLVFQADGVEIHISTTPIGVSVVVIPYGGEGDCYLLSPTETERFLSQYPDIEYIGVLDEDE